MNSFFRFAATIIWISSFVFISNIAWGQAQDPAAMIQRFDKDSDGQISHDEAPPRLKEMFEQFEAHPDSVIMVKGSDDSESLQTFIQTDDVKLRKKHAQTCNHTLKLSFPMLMDAVDNKINAAYAGWPIRLVIVGQDSKIIDPGSKGPQGFQPEKLEAWLKDFSEKKKK